MPEEVKTEAMRELNRLARISPHSPEYGVTRTYLEWMATLPWSISSGTQVDVKRAAEILDEDHYDLEKVKDRILDYLAVLQLKPVLKGPILCFVGPPGVGKTSLGKSIARALGRKFARISMGGMHDEAEIRGHRRTYIGALPGQIIQALRRAGANDPVFMLDEVDKLGRDFRGDPASALLEVLDPEQNSTFRDNYLDVPFDLSQGPLHHHRQRARSRSRCAARSHGDHPARRLHRAGKGDHRVPLPDSAPDQRKRPRRRERASISPTKRCASSSAATRAKPACAIWSARSAPSAASRRGASPRATREKMEVTPELVEKDLGAPRFRTDAEVAERTSRPGVAVGLAWTPVGGDVLFIEAGRMPGGSKGLIMTGQLGPVMQESVQAALTWVRGNADELRHRPRSVQDQRHPCPRSGRRDPQGRSFGRNHHGDARCFRCSPTGACRPNLAMTGEITLTGQVLPVGGIKEKVLAAKRERRARSDPAVRKRSQCERRSEERADRRHEDPLCEDDGRSGRTGALSGGSATGLTVQPVTAIRHTLSKVRRPGPFRRNESSLSHSLSATLHSTRPSTSWQRDR